MLLFPSKPIDVPLVAEADVAYHQPLVVTNVADVNPAPLNAAYPILVVAAGMVMLVKAEQL